ncbi:hypothetical protein D3C87_2137580 [compost metagenome]
MTLENDTVFVEITGAAAEMVFKSLKVQSYFSKAPEATVKSEIKSFQMISCEKTAEQFTCSIAADLVALEQ